MLTLKIALLVIMYTDTYGSYSNTTPHQPNSAVKVYKTTPNPSKIINLKSRFVFVSIGLLIRIKRSFSLSIFHI